jgi:hypothetical protein
MNQEPRGERHPLRHAPRSEIAWPEGHHDVGATSSSGRPATRQGNVSWGLVPASRSVRAVYLLAMAPLLFPLGVAAIAVFPGLFASRVSGASFAVVLSMGLPSVLALVAVLWRVMDVLRGRSQLAAPQAIGVLHWVRQISLLLMLVGIAATLLTWFSGPIVRTVVPTRSEAGVEFFMARMWLSGFTFWAPAGVLMFECGRLLGFEREVRAD